LLVFPHPQDGQKRLLRDIDFPDALLAFFLLFEELALARDVSAIALGQHILAQRAERFAGNDLSADGVLDGSYLTARMLGIPINLR